LSSLTDVLNKLKQLPQAFLSQLVVALGLIYIASILANISWMLVPGADGGSAITSPGQRASTAGKSSGQSFNISSLTGLNIFGQHQIETKKVDVAPPPVQTDAPETNLNLTLSATVAEGKDGAGTAIIESGGTQGTYGIGDKISSSTAIVRQVYTDRVIIQNGARNETLMLDGVLYDSKNVAHDVATPNNNARSPRKELSLNNNPKVDKREDLKLSSRLAQQRDELAKDPKKLFELIRFSPERKGDGLAGYRLNPGAQPDLFKQAGFRPNDLAVEVNGYALNDMQQAMKVLREFRTLTEANIVVERDGIRTEILFSLDAAAVSPPAPPSREPAPRKPKGQLN
jgi:general secretion pathway protein C